jgi:hypothetical protein
VSSSSSSADVNEPRQERPNAGIDRRSEDPEARKRVAKKRKQRKAAFGGSAPAPIVNIADRRSRRQALQPDRKPSIFVAALTLDGDLHFSIAIAFAKAMASNGIAECPFRFTIHVEAGKRGADYARNSIVKAFLESDCDWLMMIDQDEVVPDDFWKLCCVTDADVVSGVTPVWVNNMDPEAMLRVNNYGVDNQGQCYNLPLQSHLKQPYRVPIVGTGCIAIRRRVFAPKPSGLGSDPFYFTFMEDRKVKAGEDINFGVECNRNGFVVCVHPLVMFDHVKALSLWQVEAYYLARKKMEDEGRSTTDEQRLSIG